MADLIQKYQIQQKTADGMLTLHPETEGTIVTVTPVANKFTSTNAQAALEELGGKIATLESGTVTDVKVKTGDADATTVVVDGVATVDVSGKVDKVAGKGLSTNDYDDAAVAAVADVANKVDKVDGKGLSTNDYDDAAVAEVAKIAGKQDAITASNKLSADLVEDGTTNKVYTATEQTKLSGITEGATKVESSTTNGNIKINGVETIVFTPDAADAYTVVKDDNSGDYAAIYHLTKNGENVGVAINIPKDLVVKSGSVVEVEGKKVIRLVLVNDETIDVPVDSLVDIYTSGTGITVDATARTISIDRTTVDTYYDAAGTASGLVTALENGQVKTNADNISALQTTVGDDKAGLVKKVADLEAKATNVTASENNGYVKVDGTDVKVYEAPEGTVVDKTYAHITVTESSVSDGTTTFNKYDDTALAGRVTALENVGATKVEASETNGKIKINGTDTTVYDDTALAARVSTNETAIGDANSGLTKKVADLEGKFTNAVSAGTYSVVQTNDSGIVTAAGQILEVGAKGQTSPSDSLVTGGLFFKCIEA